MSCLPPRGVYDMHEPRAGMAGEPGPDGGG